MRLPANLPALILTATLPLFAALPATLVVLDVGAARPVPIPRLSDATLGKAAALLFRVCGGVIAQALFSPPPPLH